MNVILPGTAPCPSFPVTEYGCQSNKQQGALTIPRHPENTELKKIILYQHAGNKPTFPPSPW